MHTDGPLMGWRDGGLLNAGALRRRVEHGDSPRGGSAIGSNWRLRGLLLLLSLALVPPTVANAAPTVAAVDPHPSCITDAGVISGFGLIIAYSEYMDHSGSAAPVIAFDPDISSTLSEPLFIWDQYFPGSGAFLTVLYSVRDAGVSLDCVKIHISGARSRAGVAQEPYTSGCSFDIHMGEAGPGMHVITASSGLTGSIMPSGAIAMDDGASQFYSIAAAPGYHVADVLVDAVSIGPVAEYTFTDIREDHTISVSFAINTYTVTYTAGSNGTINGISRQVVEYRGNGSAVTAEPNAGYHFVSWSDGVKDATRIDGPVTCDIDVAAAFAVDTGPAPEVVYVGCSPSSTITNANIVSLFALIIGYDVDIRDVPRITFDPDISSMLPAPVFGSISFFPGSGVFFIQALYSPRVAAIDVDCVKVHIEGAKSFGGITQVPYTSGCLFDVHMEAPHSITASAGPNGSIMPSGVVTLVDGADQVYAINADAGYDVADVLVDGVSIGPVTSYTFSNIKENHTISAAFGRESCVVTATAGSGGSITPSGAVAVDYGANQTFKLAPSAGYHVADVVVDGTSRGALAEYTFESVTASHTISAAFTRDHVITSSAGANGSITPYGEVWVAYGSSQTYTITPETGYRIADVAVDGASVGRVASYTFRNVTVSHSISAAFTVDTVTITAASGAHGAISPAGAVAVPFGGSQTFVMAPGTDYHVANVVVDGASVGAADSYTFTNVTTAHRISVTFAANGHVITSSAGPDGAINPSGVIGVDQGASQRFVVTPSAHYRIADVAVDGRSIGAISSYTFQNVLADHSITAAFALEEYELTITLDGKGIVEPLGGTYPYGTLAQLTARPDPGWSFLGWTGAATGTAPSFGLLMDADKLVGAVFVGGMCTIRASAGSGGSINPRGSVSVLYGGSQRFTIRPTANYRIRDVVVDGSSVGAVSTYTFRDVRADHAIAASFQLQTLTIRAKAGLHGTISPRGAVSVSYGASRSFTITPEPGYAVADVLVDGVSVGAVTKFTFRNVVESHTISASFARAR
jgi:hypothetical protein